ncbi:MAG: hypothetical protein Q8K58_00950 [Acidimicrobiales bacterium]|nr:hypothetical protein [Acidimicrobiales bacterium]
MRHKKLLIVPVLVGAALATGFAFAAWTSSGSGTAVAKSTTSIDSVIAPGTSAADLYPGATSSVTVTVSNPNPYPVMVHSVTAGSSTLVNVSCTAGTVTSDSRAFDADGLSQSDGSTKVIAANGSGTYVLVTHMATTAVDACKLQTFTMSLTAALASAA